MNISVYFEASAADLDVVSEEGCPVSLGAYPEANPPAIAATSAVTMVSLWYRLARLAAFSAALAAASALTSIRSADCAARWADKASFSESSRARWASTFACSECPAESRAARASASVASVERFMWAAFKWSAFLLFVAAQRPDRCAASSLTAARGVQREKAFRFGIL